MIEGYQFPKSSFLSIDKDLSIIVDRILANDNLKKLLYYADSKDPYSEPNLTEEQSIELFKNQIRLIPKLPVESKMQPYIFITFDNFVRNDNNPEYRDNIIIFDIACHLDQWQLKDMQLRPFRIAAELDTMFEKQRLSGIGKTEFVSCIQSVLSDEFGGLSLTFRVVHGGEDKINAPTPQLNKQLLDNFNKIFNEKMDNS